MKFYLYRNGVTELVGVYTDYSDLEKYVERGLNENNDNTYAAYVDDGKDVYKAYAYDDRMVEIPAIFFNRLS